MGYPIMNLKNVRCNLILQRTFFACIEWLFCQESLFQFFTSKAKVDQAKF